MYPEIPKPTELPGLKGLLDQLKEKTFETAKGLFKWIGGLFTAEDPEKGGKGIWQKLKEKLFGPALGVLSFIAGIGKEEAKETAGEINQGVPYDLLEIKTEEISKIDDRLLKLKKQQEREDALKEIHQLQPLEGLESLPPDQRILKAVDAALAQKIRGRNCWNWDEKVYWLAGYSDSDRTIVSNKCLLERIDYFKNDAARARQLKAIQEREREMEQEKIKINNNLSLTNVEKKGRLNALDNECREISKPRRDCGQFHLSEEQVRDTLETGDWLFINNQNYEDDWGNHSVIFLGWTDRENLIAKTASCPGKNLTGKKYTDTDFKKMPVTCVMRAKHATASPLLLS